MVGKDAWRWINGVKAIVWRKERHVDVQSMDEIFFVVPLVWITRMDMKVDGYERCKRMLFEFTLLSLFELTCHMVLSTALIKLPSLR